LLGFFSYLIMTEFVQRGTPIHRRSPATWRAVPPGFVLTRAGTIIAQEYYNEPYEVGSPQKAGMPSADWIEKQHLQKYDQPLGWADLEPNKP
jgi:hypothetical protein